MRFTLRQIEYFVAAGETGSITHASERVNISQPSISAAISQLEAEFGIQLFIRHHAQGLSLTPQGLRFFREARTLLMQAEELQSIAGELSTKVTGEIEIGCLVTLYPLLVPELVHAFRGRYPSVEVNAVACDQAGVFERLRRGDISLGLTYDMELPADVVFEPLTRMPPFAFVAANHPLARRRSAPLAAFAGDPFILLDLPYSRDYFLALFRDQGLEPRTVASFEHMDVIRSLVARGDGFSIGNIRPRNRASLDGRPLAYVRLEGPVRPLKLGLATLVNARATRTAEAFSEVCRDLVRDARLPGIE